LVVDYHTRHSLTHTGQTSVTKQTWLVKLAENDLQDFRLKICNGIKRLHTNTHKLKAVKDKDGETPKKHQFEKNVFRAV
jgi:hypothetical protein